METAGKGIGSGLTGNYEKYGNVFHVVSDEVRVTRRADLSAHRKKKTPFGLNNK